MPLQLGMDALIDLRAGAVVGRDNQRVLRGFRVFLRDGVHPLLAASELMHPALAVQVLHRSFHLAARELLDHLPQLRLFLAHDLIERDGLHPGFLQLGEGLSGLYRLMLPPVAYQQHAVVRVQARHKLMRTAHATVPSGSGRSRARSR